jgi:hypothetical protein
MCINEKRMMVHRGERNKERGFKGGEKLRIGDD